MLKKKTSRKLYTYRDTNFQLSEFPAPDGLQGQPTL